MRSSCGRGDGGTDETGWHRDSHAQSYPLSHRFSCAKAPSIVMFVQGLHKTQRGGTPHR